MRTKAYYIKQLQKLAKKITSGRSTAAEKQFLDEYYILFDHEQNTVELSDTEQQQVYDEIKQRLNITTSEPVVRTFNFRPGRIAAVVSFFIVASICIYTMRHKKPAKASNIALAKHQPVNNKIVHGSNKAILTLADGTKIALDDHSAGTVSKQAGIRITKTADGQLVYTSSQTNNPGMANQFNTMQTPRGGIYQVNLPDGTHVWLNSSSTLKYPMAFTGSERVVELTGEAYFEVAHNPEMPFRVKSKSQTVEVLGTHFNVNAYPDEIVSKTTLLQGSVKVTATLSGTSKTIVPGQQAVLRLTGIQLHKVDAENAIAWKNGLFHFENEDIHTIMNKISRWYDVDVIYHGNVTGIRFGGTLSRFADIEKVLRKLELTNTIHFKIEGRRIIVMR